MSRLPPLLALVALACTAPAITSAGGGGARSEAPPGFWDQWGDGRAELAGYALTQPRYGEPRAGEAVLVFVTETFTEAQRVKTDGGHDDEFPVVKLNDVRDFQTGIYDYNAMTSTFVPLDGRTSRGLATKVSTSLQEWCGHAWEQWVIDPGSARRVFHSYFDGEGDQQTQESVPEGGVLADAMPLLVRGVAGELLASGEAREVPWLPRLLDSRLDHRRTAWTTAAIARAALAESIEVPAGRFEVVRWEARPAAGPATRWFVEVAAPHRLVAWERDDGERAVLLGAERRVYWQEHDEGDERLLPSLGLTPRAWPSAEPATGPRP